MDLGFKLKQLGLWTIGNVSAACNVSPAEISSAHWRDPDYVPVPLTKIDGSPKRFFTDSEAKQIIDYFKNQSKTIEEQNLWTVHRIADQLGIHHNLIVQAHWHDAESVPMPSKKVFSRRLYTNEEALQIIEYFKKRAKTKNKKAK